MKQKRLITSCMCIFWLLQTYAENYPYRSSILWVTTPDHSNWLYKTGEKATIALEIYEYGMPMDGQEVEFSIGQDGLDANKQGTVVLKNGKAKLAIGTMKKPGFRDCRLSIKRGEHTYRHHVKVGFSPEKIEPFTKMPQDFDAFWNDNLEQQAACPMKPEVTYVKEYSSNKVDCYLVKLQCYKRGQYVYGYLTKPKQEGKYPIVICPPGAGIKPMNPLKTIAYAENGFIRFDMEIHGLNPAMSAEKYREISATFGQHHANGYLANGIHSRDSYYMKRAYLACVRAVDYLTTLPEWDGRHVAVQGGSQGGALALILAGLDKRITACVANHPALSDMAAYSEPGRTGGYPHFGRKYQGVELTQEVIKTLSYYDVVNFARRITAPVYMTWGYNDDVCPPTTSYAVYNTITSPKEALITPIHEHWTTREIMFLQLNWIKTTSKN